MDDSLQPKPWMHKVLIGAGLYNIVWGLFAVCLPGRMLGLLGFDPVPLYPQLWQCIGMIVGVYGVGYLIAGQAPFRHWPIVLVGLLGKLFGPLGFAVSLANGSLPATLGWTLVTNDLIWWAPFTLICWGAIRSQVASGSVHGTREYDDPIRELPTSTGASLGELSVEKPQLVVLLRHVGCPFCRESLAQLSAQRSQIEDRGYGIVLVHLGQRATVDEVFSRYGLQDVPRIHDPECRLYRQLGLDLGNFRELFGLHMWIRGLFSGVFLGHGIGRIQGNVLQMPGAFLIHHGQFLRGLKPGVASQPMDFLDLVQTAPEPCVPVETM